MQYRLIYKYKTKIVQKELRIIYYTKNTKNLLSIITILQQHNSMCNCWASQECSTQIMPYVGFTSM